MGTPLLWSQLLHEIGKCLPILWTHLKSSLLLQQFGLLVLYTYKIDAHAKQSCIYQRFLNDQEGSPKYWQVMGNCQLSTK